MESILNIFTKPVHFYLAYLIVVPLSCDHIMKCIKPLMKAEWSVICFANGEQQV